MKEIWLSIICVCIGHAWVPRARGQIVDTDICRRCGKFNVVKFND